MKNRKIISFFYWFLLNLFLFISIIGISICKWVNMRFDLQFEQLLFTLSSPLEGSDVSFLNEAYSYILPSIMSAFILVIIVSLLAFALRNISKPFTIKIGTHTYVLPYYKLYKILSTSSIITLFLCFIVTAYSVLNLGPYITKRLSRTQIYENHYVDPRSVSIKKMENARNLIYIYLESMETTYASIESGGYQEINYIPKLTELATNNTSFSHSNQLGGAHVTTGTTWTMGALLGSTSGVPFSLPVGTNDMEKYPEFLPGIMSLGDILNQNGYNQVFLCGSNGIFAGRETYFRQHCNYDVIDYFDAIQKGYIPEDYLVWWGYEDEILYDVAKTELLNVAALDAPFNFTMLTVDTHHVDGYVCNICPDTYSGQLQNVITCADNQIYDFISWCKQQDFYDNTTIIITGDHFRMDSTLIKDSYDRRLYNCYINTATDTLPETENREFTSLDFFPTTLGAMGFEIEGNRLGLGTNLFSDKKTLVEELGFDYFNSELGKFSDYYMTNFIRSHND